MAIPQIIQALASVESEIAGVARAHDETPDSLKEYPCFINYPRWGTLQHSAGEGKHNLHTIIAELHVSKSTQYEAEKQARPFIKRFQEKLAANDSLLGTVSTINEIRYAYGRLEFAGEVHLGIRFEVDVKETGTITVTA